LMIVFFCFQVFVFLVLLGMT